MKYSFFSLLFLFILFTSCFKNSNQPDLKDISGSRVFELDVKEVGAYSAAAIDSLRGAKSVIRDTSIQVIELPVSIISGSGAYPYDVTVELEKDTAAVLVANLKRTKLKTDTSIYSILSDLIDVTPKPYTATIKAGEITGIFKVYLKSNLINTDSAYKSKFIDIISYKLSKIPQDGIFSDARSTAQYPIKLKNKYENIYTATGYFYHPSVPRGYNRTITLVTVNDSTISKPVGDLSGYDVYFTIKSDNSVEVTTPSGLFPGTTGGYSLFSALPTSGPSYKPPTGPNASNWTSVYSDSCKNYYNPITKKFYLRFGYTGGTGYRIIEEILSLK